MSPRAASWLSWALMALSVALLLGGMALSLAASSAVSDLPLGGETGDSIWVVDLLIILSFSIVGAIIASRYPRNTIGWIFCSVGVTIGFNSFTGDYAEFWLAGGFGANSLGVTAAWFSSWLWILLVYVPMSLLLLLFPEGRPPSPRWRPVAWGAVLGTAGLVVGYALRAGPLTDFPQIPNPYGVDDPLVGVVGFAGSIVAAGSMVASTVSLIVRYRRARGGQRQQIKWFAYWGAVAVGIICAAVVTIPYNVSLSILIMSLSLLGLPLFTGIAIVRHRLYDIDLLINRTLVYGSLTVSLALVYFGGVTLTQVAFGALTGQQRLPQLVVVASTLLIAALINPSRRRIQDLIDRRFYRRKYDARKTLERFSETLRDETDLGGLREDLVGVVGETVQPAYASLWLRPGTVSEGPRGGGSVYSDGISTGRERPRSSGHLEEAGGRPEA